MATITERFSDADQFTAFLMRIGLSEAQRKRLIEDDFETMEELVEHFQFSTGSEIEAYLIGINKTFGNASQADRRVYFSPVIIGRIIGAILYFCHGLYTFHTIPDISEIDLERAVELSYNYHQGRRPKNDDDSDDEDLDTSLPTLKGAGNWITFREKLIIKLSHLKSRRGFPLTYLVDETERQVKSINSNYIEMDNIDIDSPEIFQQSAVHFGSAYKSDNKKLWSILESSLVNTNPYNLIASCKISKNGRKAFFALKQFFEGENFVQKMQESAMNSIMHVTYKGEFKNFKFEDYINVHLSAHKKLQEIGYNNNLGMDESTKIHHFKSNILPQADLENAITLARSKETADFTTYATFLSTEVDFKNSRKRQISRTAKDRNVSSTTTKQKKNKKQKTVDLGPVITAYVGGKKLEGRRYPKEEWNKFSNEQKKKIRSLIKERKTRKNNPNHNLQVSMQNTIQESMNSVSNAIVAGIQRANAEDDQTLATQITSDVTNPNQGQQPLAQAGTVGNFLHNARSLPNRRN